MVKLMKKLSKRAGLPPGSLVHIGEKRAEEVRITVIDYDEEQFREREIKTIEECFPLKDKPTVTWINIDGVHQTEILGELGNRFGLHSLLVEDILNTAHRPKLEDFEEHLFIMLKMIRYDKEKEEVQAEQVSIVLGPHWVISVQETPVDIFDPVRERIRKAKGRLRKLGADYLAYSLIDAIVDNYFAVLEHLAENIETMEEQVVANPSPETLADIHRAKTDIVLLRKFVWPLRDVSSAIARGDSPLIHESTDIYLRDVYDHTIQVIDTIETFREVVSGMQDIYLSSVSNKMNEVMKTLTIMASIFIPLTFLAGMYGMNFEYIPELKWHYGYFTLWAIMVVAAVVMVFYFKRRKWL